MTQHRIYLVASAGNPNYGDELIVAQWLRYLAERRPDAEVWVDSQHPGSSEVLLGHLHPNVRFTDTLFQIGWSSPGDDAWDIADFTTRAIRHPGVVPRRAAGVDLLQTVDVVHVLGGGYINSSWPRHLSAIAGAATLASEYGVRAAMTGQGLTPSAASTFLLDRLTKDFVAVDVRDTGSRKLFSSDAVTESGDDVLLSVGSHLYDQRESRSVMLCLQSDHLEVSVGSLAETAVATLNAWGVEGSQIGYVEAIPVTDRRVFDLIEPMFPGMRFYPFTEIWREGLPARRGQRWLTTRFHPHLVAAAAGAWGIAVPVSEDYYGVKHDSLISRGSQWVAVAPGQGTSQAHGGAGFGSALVDLVAAKQAVAATIYPG